MLIYIESNLLFYFLYNTAWTNQKDNNSCMTLLVSKLKVIVFFFVEKLESVQISADSDKIVGLYYTTTKYSTCLLILNEVQ